LFCLIHNIHAVCGRDEEKKNGTVMCTVTKNATFGPGVTEGEKTQTDIL